MLLAGATLPLPAVTACSKNRLRIDLGNIKPADKRDVDVLICGAGPAGIGAAVTASRTGRKVLLVERYGRIGGAAVHSLVAPLLGNVESPVVEEILKAIGGRTVDYDFLDIQYADIVQKAGAGLILHAWALQPVMKGNRVTGSLLVTKEGIIEVSAKVVIDATGDGDIAWATGCEFEKGRKAGPVWDADGLMQPMTIQFTVGGVDHEKTMEANGGRYDYVFPDGRNWDQVTVEANKRGELPEHVGKVRTYKAHRENERIINATQVNYVDGTKVDDLTRAEIEGRKQAGIIVDFLKKYAPGFEDCYIANMPAAVGVRETRRFLGEYYLDRADLIEGREFPDAIVRKAEFIIDIHNPTGIGQAEGKSRKYPAGRDAVVKPYDIPFRSIIPKGVDGMLLSGRCISGSHDAMASYRVQVIAMGIGAGAGAAAALAVEDKVDPRYADVSEIQKLLF
jgi:hypothetical protein